MRDKAKNDIVLFSTIFKTCIGPDMVSWTRHYVVEVCARPSALLVLKCGSLAHEKCSRRLHCSYFHSLSPRRSTGKTSRQIAMVKNKDATTERVVSKRSSRVRKAKAVAHKSKSKSVGAKAAVAARLKPGVRPGMRRRSRK